MKCSKCRVSPRRHYRRTLSRIRPHAYLILRLISYRLSFLSLMNKLTSPPQLRTRKFVAFLHIRHPIPQSIPPPPRQSCLTTVHSIAMGFIFGTVRRLATVGLVGTTGAAAYLAARNPVISPLSPADPIWSSSLYKKHNPSRNPATQDVVIKRVPLDKIRPELIQKESDLTLELCRGVWSGWGALRACLAILLVNERARETDLGE